MKLKIQRSQSIQSPSRIDDLPSIAECEEEQDGDKKEPIEHSEEHSEEQKQSSSQGSSLPLIQTTPSLSEEGISPQSSSVEEIPNWDAAALRIITFLSSRINPNVSLYSSLFIHRLVV